MGISSARYLAAGIAFAFLWSSAATATKAGLESAQPFVIATGRFFMAGGIMLIMSHIFRPNRMPRGREWKQLAIYGLLNISIYLGLYVLAMQNVSAGIGSLAVAVNPVLISLMSAAWFGVRIRGYNVLSMSLCLAGILLVAYPLIKDSQASIGGIVTLLGSMAAYSVAAIYYSRKTWNELDILTINGWQTLFGGIFLLPVLWITYSPGLNNLDQHYWIATGWLAIPVSIVAVQLWLYLLRQHPVRASYWLFLCPVFGFFIARVVMDEPITLFTIAGSLLVLTGLYILLKKRE